MESYLFWDWPLPGGQLSAGFDVPLPGSDILLPQADGYLVAPATTLAQEAKQEPVVIQPLDLEFDDDWASLDNSVIQNPDDLFSDDLGLESACLLPSSPEGDAFDLNEVNFGQPRWEPVVHLEGPGDKFAASIVHQDSVASLGDGPVRVLETDSVKFFDDAGNFDSDFDPGWLLSSSSVPILPPVSLEEVESVLSASPISIASSPELEMYSPVEFKRQFATIPSPFEACIQLSESPLNVLLSDTRIISENTRHAMAQVPQTVTWLGDGSVGGLTPCFSGLQVPENTLFMATSPVDFSSADSNSSTSVSSTLSFEEGVFDPVEKLPRPASGQFVRVEPYPTAKPERRERKREQNKTAACKYRQRKRAEQGDFVSEHDQLEKRNGELKSRVDELTREINYLKGLISEIYSSETE
jgi:hypothetical protein